jgi:hypothetical protein
MKQKGRVFFTLVFMFLFANLCSIAQEIGVYLPMEPKRATPGADGILKTLKSSGLNAKRLELLSPDELGQCNTVILSGMHSLALDESPFWRDFLRMFLKCGGNIVLTHDACGYRRVMSNPLFPEYFKGKYIRPFNTFILKDKNNPICKGLPEKFKIGYVDHLVLDASKACRELIVNEKGEPVVVLVRSKGIGGSFGGYLVGMGSITGYVSVGGGYNGKNDIPPDDEKKMLLNILRFINKGSELDKKQFESLAIATSAVLELGKNAERMSGRLNALENELAKLKKPEKTLTIVPEPQNMTMEKGVCEIGENAFSRRKS